MKKYVSPEIEISIFETSDIITVSRLQLSTQNNTPADMTVNYDNTFWN